jgi:MFS family permease
VTSISLPVHARNLGSFSTLNAVCFTIALGSPLVLTARFLGAGEALVGILLALTPLFTVLQLPAARYADRWGYRRLFMMGWRARAIALLLMAPLPLLVGHVPGRLVLILFTMFAVVFNAVRGFSSGSWLPWLKQLIPVERLGRFFGTESFMMQMAILITLWTCGWFLGNNPPAWHYSALLLVSGTAGFLSVLPLRHIPSAPTAGPAGRSPEPIALTIRRVWGVRNFRRIVMFTAFNGAAMAATPGFVVLYLKEVNHLAEGLVVTITSLATIGALAAALVASRRLDRAGSRPALRIAAAGHLGVYLFWTLHAAVGAPPHLGILLPFFFIGGLTGNAGGLAAGRLLLSECPRTDSTTAMAVAQVAQTMSGGLAVVFWGFALEAMRKEEAFGQLSRIPFLVYFAVTLGLMGLSVLLLQRVQETSQARS